MALIRTIGKSTTDNLIIVIPNDTPNATVAGVDTVTTSTLASGMKGTANCVGKNTITCNVTMNWIGISANGTITQLPEAESADVTNYDYVAFHRGTNTAYTFTLS